VSSDLQAALKVVPAVPTAADVEELRAAWREAAEDAGRAWHVWCNADVDDAFDAYVAYVAASDRETVAAETYRRYHDVVLPRAHRR
jgi:alkanesulfonate monooxygenase SsuD/methylene tetrahydromethanopterin reductase-like flavin-dependent oxidoreductase (luciferase family)